MPAGQAIVVVDLRLRLRVLCFVEALPIGVLPATMDNLLQDIAVLLLYSVFSPVVPLVLLEAEAVSWAAYFALECHACTTITW